MTLGNMRENGVRSLDSLLRNQWCGFRRYNKIRSIQYCQAALGRCSRVRRSFLPIEQSDLTKQFARRKSCEHQHLSVTAVGNQACGVGYYK